MPTPEVVAAAARQNNPPPPAGWVPIPDPTLLTTASVKAAIADFKELQDAKGETVKTRLDGMDLAIKLVAADAARIAENVREATVHLRDDMDRHLAAMRESLTAQVEQVTAVNQEKFTAFTVQIADRDDQRKQDRIDSKVSLDAALAAQSALVAQQNAANEKQNNRMETTFEKRIDDLVAAFEKRMDALTALVTTQNKAVDEKVNDLKSRLDKAPGEQAAVVRTEVVGSAYESRAQAAGRAVNYNLVVVVIGVVLAVAGLILSLGTGGG